LLEETATSSKQSVQRTSHTKVALVKLYDRKGNALVAAEMLNDKVLPFFEGHDVRLLRILTDRGSESCGNLSSTNTNCISRWKTSITRRPKPSHRKLRALSSHYPRGVLPGSV
jgi:hypothetical protein